MRFGHGSAHNDKGPRCGTHIHIETWARTMQCCRTGARLYSYRQQKGQLELRRADELTFHYSPHACMYEDQSGSSTNGMRCEGVIYHLEPGTAGPGYATTG